MGQGGLHRIPGRGALWRSHLGLALFWFAALGALYGGAARWLQPNTTATFHTANGPHPGRLVRAQTVEFGPLSVHPLTVGTGYTGESAQSALLGRTFSSSWMCGCGGM